MEIVKKGVHYVAKGSNDHSTEIKFCHKDEAGIFINGITNEEMIDVMINRFQFLVDKYASTENIQCLLHLRQVKDRLLDRNKNKLKRRAHDNSGGVIPIQVAS